VSWGERVIDGRLLVCVWVKWLFTPVSFFWSGFPPNLQKYTYKKEIEEKQKHVTPEILKPHISLKIKYTEFKQNKTEATKYEKIKPSLIHYAAAHWMRRPEEFGESDEKRRVEQVIVEGTSLVRVWGTWHGVTALMTSRDLSGSSNRSRWENDTKRVKTAQSFRSCLREGFYYN